MILVDTSVWIDHLRNRNERLQHILNDGDAVCHPMIIGDLACGNLTNRKEILSLLHALPSIEKVSEEELLFFLEKHDLYGKGLGLIDIHLLASCSVGNTRIWSLDKRLEKTARKLGLG